jgi:hypothetical protein
MVAIPIGQSAQATGISCNSSSVCTIPSGNYSSPAALSLAASAPPTQIYNYGNFDLSSGGYVMSVSTTSVGGYEFTNYGVLNLSVPSNGNASTVFSSALLTSAGETGSDNGGGGSGPIRATIGGSLELGYKSSTGAGGLYGLDLSSSGGNGGNGHDEYRNDRDPGLGGSAGEVDLALVGADVQVSSSSQDASGAAVRVRLKGGNGGSSVEDQNGKPGGATGTLHTTLNGSQLRGSGSGIAGLQLSVEGGAGGKGGQNERSNGASGGGPTQLTLEIATSAAGSVVSTNGSKAPAITISSLGGAGGAGAAPEGAYDIDAGNGGHGGSAGGITVDASGAVHASTLGGNSAGISVLSQGGVGGAGGRATSYASGAYSGIGGAGGSAGAVVVTLGNGKTGSGDGTRVETAGASSPALALVLAGGNGGIGGVASTSSGRAEARDGGKGGSTGAVSVEIADSVTLRTTGSDGYGVLVKSASGLGGDGGKASGGIDIHSTGGNGGSGGDTGAISVTSAGTIDTSGSSARGILVQAAAGYGGKGGVGDGAISGEAGDGGASGSIGKITILNSGSITTRGAGAQGMLAQSLGGGGGAGGEASGSFFYSAGGDGGNSSDGKRSDEFE